MAEKRGKWLAGYFKESWAVTVAIAGTVVGGIAIALDWLEIKDPVPPKLTWILCMAAVIGAQLWIYRKLYLRHEALKDAARNHARFPPVQRARVHHIKELASRIRAGIEGYGSSEPEVLYPCLTQLDSEAGAISEHWQITDKATLFRARIRAGILAIVEAADGDKKSILGKLKHDLEQPYLDLIKACNDLLEEYPPSTAD